jgi:cytochrome oxidase Cu insertion factor (SCO1/SenC/PrrC family)
MTVCRFWIGNDKQRLRRANVMAKVELNVQAPDFTLDDFNGKSVSLSDYKNKKNVMVVFNRGFF